MTAVTRPRCCANCESRSVTQHCRLTGCPWVSCTKCGAVTFYWRGRRHHRGGVDRWQDQPRTEDGGTR